MTRRRSLHFSTLPSKGGFALLAALMAFVVPNSAQADSVRTSTSNGFARLHFTLEPAAHAKAALSGSVLTIAFDRKVAIAPASVAQGLGSYISSIREDDDGQTFRIALAQSVRLHTSVSGASIAVDLAPDSFAGTPPDLPPPPPAARTAVDVAGLPALSIRVGAYSTFSRLVFDWPRNVAYAVFPGAGHLTVRFEAMARPDFAALESVAPPWVKEAGWRIEGRGTVLEFGTDASSGFHDFRDGSKIVLDILAPKADASAYRPPTDSGRPAGKLKVTKFAASATGVAQAKAVLDTAQALKGDDAPKSIGGAAKTVQPVPPAAPPPAPPPTSTADTQAAFANPAPAQAAAVSPVQVQRSHGRLVFEFAGAGERSAAAFVRGATAWIVIDGVPPVDPQQLKDKLGDLSFDASSDAGASVLRIALKHPEKIAVSAQGGDLKVILSPDAWADTTAIGFLRGEDPGRPVLTAVLPGAVHTVKLVDPVVGDSLIVVPSTAGFAAPQPRSYAEFSILPTAAGLAIAPFTDDLEVSVEAGRVTIGRPAGLALALASQPSADSPAALAPGSNSPCFLDFVSWARAPGGSFLESQRRLRAASTSFEPGVADRAQMKLAQLYLARGFAAEALGVVNLFQGAHPALKDDSQLQTMRAAADYMLGRMRDAHNDIAGVAFDGDRHAAFWRGLIEAAQWNWDAARKDLALAAPVLGRYAPEWQARARIADARAALAANAIEAADTDLAKLPDRLPKALVMQAQIVRARLLAAQGRYGDARSIFASIENSGDERAGADAVYAHVEAGLATGAMSRDAAIDALEQLRFRWRGDILELETLRKLGALYFAKQRWHQGLATLRIASQNFPNDDLARAAQDQMRATFDTLFLKGGADRMPPVQALGLFYDFIDLTPIGPNGDEMIRRMADRLVAVDLLEPAAALLDYQVNKRLDGIARAQVATRLAMIDLLDHKPKEALAALRESQVSGLPPDTLHQRMVLQARALAALKQWDQALDMIATDDSEDSRTLRADIYWESGNWDLAGQKAEAMAAPAAADPKPLSDDTRARILRAAIAYSLANDEAGLERLRKTFAVRMGASPDASAFAVVTQKLDTEGTAFREMAGQIASIDTLETFMRDFRKRYDAGRMTN
jgi:hypothetical protein